MKNVDNGTIGEVRTKAFLIDRFWILERSIDIQGADYIIQRKFTEQNILDKNPPRFGVIQVKFMQDNKTSHYIHSEYILDKNQEPRNEFFLMIHTGNEENSRKFLISASEIKENFNRSAKGENIGKFIISGGIINSSKYEVTNNKHGLDRIEHAIRLADFASNRIFLSRTLPSFTNSQAIDYEYTLPIKNASVNDITEELSKVKEKLRSMLFDRAEIDKIIVDALNETDPFKVIKIINELHQEFGLFDWALISDIENLEYATKEHKEKYVLLKGAGVLDQYLRIQKKLEKEAMNYLEPRMDNLTEEQLYLLTMEYDKENLEINDIKSEIKIKGEIKLSEGSLSDFMGFSYSNPGDMAYYYFPKKFGGYTGDTWNDKLRKALHMIIEPYMDEIYFNLFPEKRIY